MTTKNPILLSIIIPVYNVERYLHECLDSILASTFKTVLQTPLALYVMNMPNRIVEYVFFINTMVDQAVPETLVLKSAEPRG